MLKQEKLTKLEAELEHVKAAYSELKEQSKNEVTLAQQILNRRIKEKEAILSNLQETMINQEHTITVLEEQLRKAKDSYNELGERLGQEIKEIKQRENNEFALRCFREQELKEKEALLNELEEKLRAEKESRERREEELASRSGTEQSLRHEISEMQNDLVQFQEKLENETCRRRTVEHRLEENVSTVRELQTTLRHEQKIKRRVEEELNHAREKERLFEIEKRWRQTQEIQLNEKIIMLAQAQETISLMTDELNEVRRSTNEDVERLQRQLNQEISLRNRKEQELGVLEQHLEENENALSEQRRLLGEERQQRATSEESLRTVQREMVDYRHRQEARERELQSHLSAAHKSLAEYQPRDWIIRREEVVVSGTSLGRGAWGRVHKGSFRCCPVAVKEIHEVIISDYNRELFEREMTFASRSRHPNLLQFIASTIDDGSPLFVTELLDTSLRDLLSQQVLVDIEIYNLAIDTARGLNYLHLNEPLPIVHRDISSANVLLYRRGESWSAKLSDYGSANFVRQLMTVNPGASIYAAPEASTSNSTTKVDVYSYGVLLCEMCTRELPNPERRENQIRQVAGTSLRRLITRCTMTDADQRPAMSDILSELERLRENPGVISMVRNFLIM
ncbi:probable serine/threonine-protein kinase DDB_G0271682 [Stylophora pistillata]|nr:probable serine/threonine-protein kinase DDB_G0271682 [Stylophora pistillata]